MKNAVNVSRIARRAIIGASIGASILASGAMGMGGEPAISQHRMGIEGTVSIPNAARLRVWHDLVASEPHIAGSEGDQHVIEKLVSTFRDLGLEVERHDIWPLLPTPVSAKVEVIAPDIPGGRGELPLKEKSLPEDPDTLNTALTFGWNGYSGSGDATGDVVYANYGRKEDYEKLASLGVDVRGKIVIARYGGNFRGYKAKFAQAAGAAALIIYTDPADSGYARGLMYPEGGFANETCIERGSLLTLDYIGDPLTPGVEATMNAPRVAIESVAMPTIPVQPMAWSGVVEIMKRMRGAAVPTGWQGGLPLPYRVDGNGAVQVRVAVQQKREITPTANVVATMRGQTYPDETIVLGCHHDAWGFGAADPTCGLITLIEAARSLSEMRAQGWKPARSIVFAAWGAEEMGIIGSSEWVESRRDKLERDGVMYINLDMASMGPSFGSAASPSVQGIVEEAMKRVPLAREATRTVFDAWKAGGGGFGDLGGGSDHVGFLCHAMVPSAAFGAGGAAGTSYHSIYDTRVWYRKVVGEDYEPALMVTRMAATAAALAGGPALVPLEPWRYGSETARLLGAIRDDAAKLGVEWHASVERVEALIEKCHALTPIGEAARSRLAAMTDAGVIDAANRELIACDRAWKRDAGLTGRAWFKNLYAAPDRDSGYAAWMLPELRRAVSDKDLEGFDRAIGEYEHVIADLSARIDRMARP